MGVKEPNRYNLNLSEDVSKWLEQQKKSTGKSYLVGYNICETENKIGVSLQNSKQKKATIENRSFFLLNIFLFEEQDSVILEVLEVLKNFCNETKKI